MSFGGEVLRVWVLIGSQILLLTMKAKGSQLLIPLSWQMEHGQVSYLGLAKQMFYKKNLNV
jgi:hypothetical protein